MTNVRIRTNVCLLVKIRAFENLFGTVIVLGVGSSLRRYFVRVGKPWYVFHWRRLPLSSPTNSPVSSMAVPGIS